MTQFTVIPSSRNVPLSFSGAALMQSTWDDFGFKTTYILYLSVPEFTGRVGAVKILRRNQTISATSLLPIGSLESLDTEFVSLGQDLDYYERLATLPDGLRQEILSFLRDALSVPDHAATFFQEPGWTTSVLRDTDWNSFRLDASVLLSRDYNLVAKLGVHLTFQVNGWADPLIVRFDSPNDTFLWGPSHVLPDRIMVLVGRNGSGKSTLLARLARIIHASQRDRLQPPLSELGSIEPPGIGFTRVVNVAYSAFDAFQFPGVDLAERLQIVDDMEKGTGRYYFCGLRDIMREVRRTDGVGDIDGMPIVAQGPDRQQEVLLKSNQQLAAEFGRTVRSINSQGRSALFEEVCKILASDTSFSDLGTDLGRTVSNDPDALFQSWSTGHKIVMHTAASLVAFTEPKSIVLMDEPESHLHPPLLAALMHAVRVILQRKNAFAVIATHSPVVVQETLSRHIAIVRRSDDEIRIFAPRVQTYGESIGEITNEIFGLNADATDFHKTLSLLVDANLTLGDIEGLFDHGLSLQARAFVMTKLAQK